MVKKSGLIFGIVAILTLSAAVCFGYTVTKWPAPGIPGAVYHGESPCVPNPENLTLKGPVAPACEPPLIPGVIHGALSIPYRIVGIAAAGAFLGKCPPASCCDVELGEPAYVTAAVPCTPVNTYTPPKGW